VHVVEGGRRGYEIVAGHDLSASRADVLVEPGLARAWHLHPGSTLVVSQLGELRVAGEALEPDNVAYPLASPARVHLGRAHVDRRLPARAVRRALGCPRAALARAAARRAAAIAVPAAAAGLALGWALARGRTGTLLATLNEAPPGAAVLGPMALSLAGVV